MKTQRRLEKALRLARRLVFDCNTGKQSKKITIIKSLLAGNWESRFKNRENERMLNFHM